MKIIVKCKTRARSAAGAVSEPMLNTTREIIADTRVVFALIPRLPAWGI